MSVLEWWVLSKPDVRSVSGGLQRTGTGKRLLNNWARIPARRLLLSIYVWNGGQCGLCVASGVAP